MKIKTTLFALAFITLMFLFTSPVSAQSDNVAGNLRVTTSDLRFVDNPRFGGSVTMAKNFDIITAVGEIRYDNFDFDDGASDGRVAAVEAEARYKFSDSFFASGGARATNTSVGTLSETTFQPTIGVGYNRDNKFIAQFVYGFEDSSPRNEASLGYRLEAYKNLGSGRFFLRGAHSLDRLYINRNASEWRASVSGGIGFRF